MMKSGPRINDKLFYGWVVVIASFFIILIVLGIRLSFGVFFKSLASDFGLNRAETSGVYSAHMLLSCLFAIVCGWGVDKFGPKILVALMGFFIGLSLILTSQTHSLWQLCVVYSFLFAVGAGGVFGVLMSIIVRWFDRKRGLAIGLTTSGIGLGTIIMPPLSTYLIANLGWRMSYVVIGLMAWLLIIPMALLLKKDPGEMGLLPDGAKSDEDKTERSDLRETGSQSSRFSLLRALKTRNFCCMGFSWVLFSFCVYMVITHIVPHVTDMGIPAMRAATILSLIGAISIPGRLLMGRMSDSIGRKTTSILCALFLAGTILWLICSKDLWMFYLFAVVFGFFYGGLDVCTTALVGDLFGLRHIGTLMGTLSAGWSLGGAAGPLIGGIVYDISNDYAVAFSLNVAAMILIAILVALMKREPNLDRKIA